LFRHSLTHGDYLLKISNLTKDGGASIVKQTIATEVKEVLILLSNEAILAELPNNMD
jgi:hypothetical protein